MTCSDIIFQDVGEGRRIWHIGIDPKHEYISICGEDKTIKVFRYCGDGSSKMFELVCDNKLSHEKTIKCVEFSPCGTFLASCSFDCFVIIWEFDRVNKALIKRDTLEGHENEVKCVEWGPLSSVSDCESYLLASCGRDKIICIWEINKEDGEGSCVSVLQEHTQDIKSIKWCLRRRLLASCSSDGCIMIWQEDQEYGDWCMLEKIVVSENTLWDLDFSKNGRFLVVCDDKNKITVFDSENKWKQVAEITATPQISDIFEYNSLYCVRWMKQRDGFVVCSEFGEIKIFELVEDNGFRLVEDIKVDIGDFISVNSLGLIEDGKVDFLSCSDNGIIRSWKIYSM